VDQKREVKWKLKRRERIGRLIIQIPRRGDLIRSVGFCAHWGEEEKVSMKRMKTPKDVQGGGE
jgi:hypothetical protein